MVLQAPNRGEDHFPGPAGWTLANTAQDAVDLLCCKGTLPTQVPLVVQQDTQDVFCRAASNTVSPKTVQLHGCHVCLFLPIRKFPDCHDVLKMTESSFIMTSSRNFSTHLIPQIYIPSRGLSDPKFKGARE